MKKLILKGVIFIGLLLAINNIVVDPMFSNVNQNSFKKTISEFYNTNKKDSIDILIFGSSHSMNSYNPRVIDKTLNTFTFNLATAAQKLTTTKYLIEEAVSFSKPKYVVLDIFHFTALNTINEDQESFQFLVFNSTKSSLNKLKSIYSNYGMDKILSVYSPLTRNHAKWNELKIKRDTFSYFETYRGFVPLKGNMTELKRKEFSDFYSKNYGEIKTESSLQVMTKSQRELIIEIYEFLKSKNIELIIVTAPYINYFYSETDIKFNLALNQLSDSLRINYLDFNKFFNQLDLDFKDFKESGHVNINGANKLSAYLSKYLSEKTSLKLENDQYVKEFLDVITPRTAEENKLRIEEERKGLIEKLVERGVSLKKSHEFLEGVHANEFIFYADYFNKYIAFEYENPLIEELLKDKVFGLQGVAYDKDLDRLPSWVVAKNGNGTTWRGIPEAIKIKGKNYILLKIAKNCDIEQWKQIRIFLIDKDEYKGALGSVLEIDDIMFSLPEGITFEEQREIIRKRESPLNDIIRDGIKVTQTHKFTEDFTLNEFIFYSNKNNRFIIIPSPDDNSIEYLKDKAFGIHGTAHDRDLDKLPSWVVEKKGNKTSWKGVPKKVELHGKNYLMMELPKNCSIEQWKEIRIFLIDREEYKGSIGSALELRDVKFQNNN